jgi:hypothetical protein
MEPVRLEGASSIAKSTDGGSNWRQLASTSFSAPQNPRLDFNYDSRLTMDSDMPRNSWQKILGGDGIYSAIANTGSFFYASTNGGQVRRLQVDSQGTIIRSTLVAPAGTLTFRTRFVLNPNNSDMMFFGSSKEDEFRDENNRLLGFLWRNHDLTEIPDQSFNPTEINWNVLENTRVSGLITGLAVTTSNPSHRVYYGTGIIQDAANVGRLFRLDDAHAGMPVPVDISSSAFPRTDVTSIAVNPDDGDELLVVFGQHDVPSLFYSNNGGGAWVNVGGNLEQHPDGTGDGPALQAAAILPLIDGTTYYLAGGSTGLYATSVLDGDATVWVQEGMANIGYAPVEMLASRASDGLVAVATHGSGIFSANITDVASSVHQDPNRPNGFKLSQSYPTRLIQLRPSDMWSRRSHRWSCEFTIYRARKSKP